MSVFSFTLFYVFNGFHFAVLPVPPKVAIAFYMIKRRNNFGLTKIHASIVYKIVFKPVIFTVCMHLCVHA